MFSRGLSLTGYDILEIVRSCKSGDRSVFQYNLYETDVVLNVKCDNEVISVKYGDLEGVLVVEIVLDIVKEKSDWVFEITRDHYLRPLAYYGEHGFVRLKAVKPRYSTTLEINGIHMHRIVGSTPFGDAVSKVRRAGVRKNSRVLDTCTGLGYTAIAALMKGARQVVTVEVNEYVLFLAERNPWSWGLADKKVTIIHGDIARVIGLLPSNYFDVIIHDPPSILIAGELYSGSFYRELYRVLRPGGRMLHYVGETGKHGRFNIVKGVAKRLKNAGFIVRGYDVNTKTVLSIKPRDVGW